MSYLEAALDFFSQIEHQIDFNDCPMFKPESIHDQLNHLHIMCQLQRYYLTDLEWLKKQNLSVDDEYKLAQLLYWGTDKLRDTDDNQEKLDLFRRAHDINYWINTRTLEHYNMDTMVNHFWNEKGKIMIYIQNQLKK